MGVKGPFSNKEVTADTYTAEEVRGLVPGTKNTSFELLELYLIFRKK